jgi:Protein of unknown function (DUF4058)
MPLRDHFRVGRNHGWSEIHGGWPMEICRHLLTILPKGFRGTPQVHSGAPSEIDIATFEYDGTPASRYLEGGTTATLLQESPTLTIEADLSDQDEFEVRIYNEEMGRELVAMIELISPSNKDRPESRDKFVNKCVGLLQKGICVSMVDLITPRRSNLYVEVLARLGATDPNLGLLPPHLYAVTMRSRPRPKGRELVDAWFYPMAIGEPLPTIPIWLRPDLRVSLPLETSYESTCEILGAN